MELPKSREATSWNALFILVGSIFSAQAAARPAAPPPPSHETSLAPTDPARLLGLWGSDRIFGPEVSGALTIEKHGAAWGASISGYSPPVRVEGSALSLVLPGNRGAFRGRLQPKSLAIQGHWIQPRRITSGSAYASPLELRPLGRQTKGWQAWRGEVVPLEDRFSLYLAVAQQPDGTVQAFFRNPERNFGRASLYNVSLDGSKVRLMDPKTGQSRFEGSYDARADRLTFQFESLEGNTFDFSRRSPAEAPGFYPRTPALAHYEYRQPIDMEDGWETAPLPAVGLDPAPVSALIQRILDVDATIARFPYVQALLIARHGKLALEEYFYGFSQERTHDLRSAGKSFTTTLIGIALDNRAKFEVETPVLSLFPEYRELANPDPRKHAITVEHLLTMSTGLACDDDDENSPGQEDRMQQQQAQLDWYKFTLDLPIAHPPGEIASYCTATLNLLGGVLRNATGEWLPDLFHRYLARPLQFRRYYLNLMPLGDGYGGGGIYLRPRDAIKLGQLFLNGGVWKGRRVVSQHWIAQATRVHTHLTGGPVDGYNWWIQDLNVGNRVFHTYSASGNGGQRIIVVPQLDLVVMFAGGNYNDGRVWRKFLEEFVPQYILPAVTVD